MVAPSKKQDFLFGGKDDRICSNGQIFPAKGQTTPKPRFAFLLCGVLVLVLWMKGF
jgi:hypothetical protein